MWRSHLQAIRKKTSLPDIHFSNKCKEVAKKTNKAVIRKRYFKNKYIFCPGWNKVITNFLKSCRNTNTMIHDYWLKTSCQKWKIWLGKRRRKNETCYIFGRPSFYPYYLRWSCKPPKKIVEPKDLQASTCELLKDCLKNIWP